MRYFLQRKRWYTSSNKRKNLYKDLRGEARPAGEQSLGRLY